jgi:hypothetical protein
MDRVGISQSFPALPSLERRHRRMVPKTADPLLGPFRLSLRSTSSTAGQRMGLTGPRTPLDPSLSIPGRQGTLTLATEANREDGLRRTGRKGTASRPEGAKKGNDESTAFPLVDVTTSVRITAPDAGAWLVASAFRRTGQKPVLVPGTREGGS